MEGVFVIIVLVVLTLIVITKGTSGANDHAAGPTPSNTETVSAAPNAGSSEALAANETRDRVDFFRRFFAMSERSLRSFFAERGCLVDDSFASEALAFVYLLVDLRLAAFEGSSESGLERYRVAALRDDAVSGLERLVSAGEFRSSEGYTKSTIQIYFNALRQFDGAEEVLIALHSIFCERSRYVGVDPLMEMSSLTGKLIDIINRKITVSLA